MQDLSHKFFRFFNKIHFQENYDIPGKKNNIECERYVKQYKIVHYYNIQT